MFRVAPDGSIEKQLIQEEEVGGSAKGSYIFDLNAMSVTVEGTTNPSEPIVIVASGCYERSCENRREREMLFCRNNHRRLFVSNQIKWEDEDWADFGTFLGIQQSWLDPKRFTLTKASSNAINAGLQQGQQFLGWGVEVKDSKRAALSGIQTGDILFSMRGRALVSRLSIGDQ
jgi:hypothetical protein